MRSRGIERAINYWVSLPRENVAIPWRERVRRAWRDKNPRQLTRSHDIVVMHPTKGFGVKLVSYASEASTIKFDDLEAYFDE